MGAFEWRRRDALTRALGCPSCGGLPSEKRPPSVAPCKCVRTDLQKKREQDKGYRNLEDDDPQPDPTPQPNPKPRDRKGGVATLFN